MLLVQAASSSPEPIVSSHGLRNGKYTLGAWVCVSGFLENNYRGGGGLGLESCKPERVSVETNRKNTVAAYSELRRGIGDRY